MWKLRACPRCGGDVFIDKALDNWYMACLQCGYQKELREIAAPKIETPEREKMPVLVRRGRPEKVPLKVHAGSR